MFNPFFSPKNFFSDLRTSNQLTLFGLMLYQLMVVSFYIVFKVVYVTALNVPVVYYFVKKFVDDNKVVLDRLFFHLLKVSH